MDQALDLYSFVRDDGRKQRSNAEYKTNCWFLRSQDPGGFHSPATAMTLPNGLPTPISGFRLITSIEPRIRSLFVLGRLMRNAHGPNTGLF